MAGTGPARRRGTASVWPSRLSPTPSLDAAPATARRARPLRGRAAVMTGWRTRRSSRSDAARRTDCGLDAAVEHLRARQDEDGWWKGELATNVTMDAEDLLLRSSSASPRRGRPRRPPAGSGPSNAPTAPGRRSTAGRATCPPRSRPGSRCGWPATARCRAPAPGCRVRASHGGVERARVFTRIWLALFGLWSWDDCPELPPEMMYLPRVVAAQHLRLGLLGPADDRAAHHRGALEPVRPVPFGIAELRTGTPPPPRATGVTASSGLFAAARPGAARLRRRPVRRLRRARCAAPSSGSSPGRRRTAPGAASSRRGCTR